MASAIRTNTDYMFARIDMLNREYKGSIPYSVAIDEPSEATSLELFLKHDDDPEKDIELWHRDCGTQKSMQQRTVKLTAWDELKALKEIGNSYIRDLNTEGLAKLLGIDNL